jgi:hypothetical protein
LIAADSKMWPTALKVLGGSLLTFALVWVLVLGWWQSNDYEPSKLDLGLYLAALPLALVGGYLLLRGFIDHLKSPAVSASPVTRELRDEDPLVQAAAKSEAAERGFAIGMIDSFVVTSAGGSIDDTLSVVEAGKRPEPSSRLTDASGFPVFLAEVPDLDVDGTLEQSRNGGDQLRALSAHHQIMRSFSLLERLLEAASDRLNDLLERGGDSLNLRVVWMVPAAWRSDDLTVMKAWLQSVLPALPPKYKPEVLVVPISGELEAFQVFDEINLRINRDSSSQELTLLLGAASEVDEQSVEQRIGANRLFTPDHQQRQIPGEGGVAMLLAGKSLINRLQVEDSILFSRVSMGSRDKPVDAGGRVNGKAISQLAIGLLDVTGVDQASIKTAVFDTDHRANLLTEALEGVGQGFDHLDPIKDCLALGASTGSLSPIGGLLAMGCAKAKVLATDAPALCISNQHPLGRAVVLAMPLPRSAEVNSSSI